MPEINNQAIVDAFNLIIAKERKQIFWQIFKSSEADPIFQDMRVETGVQENQYYVGSNAFMSEVWQPWMLDGKTAKGALKFVPSKMLQRRHMVYNNFKPDSIRGTLLGRLSQEGKELTVRDIVTYMKDGVVKRLSDDRISSVLYRGVYSAPTANQANSAASSVDGMGKVVENGLEMADTDQRINSWSVGAWKQNTIYQQVKDAVAETPDHLWSKPMSWYWSPTLMLWYKENREATIGTRINTNDKDLYTVPGTNWTFKPAPSMTGSLRAFLTPDGNMVRIIDMMSGAEKLEALRLQVDAVTIYGDFCEAYGFDFNKLVWANRFNNASGSSLADQVETFVS